MAEGSVLATARGLTSQHTASLGWMWVPLHVTTLLCHTLTSQCGDVPRLRLQTITRPTVPFWNLIFAETALEMMVLLRWPTPLRRCL